MNLAARAIKCSCQRRLRLSKACYCSLIFTLLAFAFPAFGTEESIFPDPGLINPKIQFHAGDINTARQPQLLSMLPNIPGQPSGWFIAQWHKSEYLMPDMLRISVPQNADPLLGPPKWSFTTRDGNSSLRIFNDKDRVIFGLFQRDGILVPGGGSDTFLSANAIRSDATFDHKIEYKLDAKLAGASISYDPRTGSPVNFVPLAQVSTAFVLRFKSPTVDHPITAFLVLPHADSRNRVGLWASCTMRGPQKSVVLGFSKPGSHTPEIRFAPDNGQLHHFEYSLNARLCELVRQPFRCLDENGHSVDWQLGQDARNFKYWNIQSITIGIESGTTNLRSDSRNKEPHGHVATNLEIAGLSVMRDNSEEFRQDNCPAENAPH